MRKGQQATNVLSLCASDHYCDFHYYYLSPFPSTVVAVANNSSSSRLLYSSSVLPMHEAMNGSFLGELPMEYGATVRIIMK